MWDEGKERDRRRREEELLGEVWGDVEMCGEGGRTCGNAWGGIGMREEAWEDVYGRGEVWGGVGRCGEV